MPPHAVLCYAVFPYTQQGDDIDFQPVVALPPSDDLSLDSSSDNDVEEGNGAGGCVWSLHSCCPCSVGALDSESN